MTKIKNPLLARVLSWAADAAEKDSLRFIHELVRRADNVAFPILLTRFLRRQTSNSTLEMVPRNSVTYSGEFNLFQSDLDFSAVFENEPTVDELRRLLRGYEKFRDLFPFLGELEIYTRLEWSLKLDLQERFLPFVDLVLQLRKWKSQLKCLEDAKTPYHSSKAKKAIRRIRVKLGLPKDPGPDENLSAEIEKSIERRLEMVLPPEMVHAAKPHQPLTVRSDYLDWDLPGINFCFAAALPDGDWGFKIYLDEIQRLRQDPRIREILFALSIVELITLRHHERVDARRKDKKWYEHVRQNVIAAGGTLPWET